MLAFLQPAPERLSQSLGYLPCFTTVAERTKVLTQTMADEVVSSRRRFEDYGMSYLMSTSTCYTMHVSGTPMDSTTMTLPLALAGMQID
jgi:hypothetical protein